MFKSGDKVVFCKSSLESGMIDAKEGDVFTVHDVYNRTVSLKELPGDYHNSHFENYVEKEKVMEKYIPNVGDKVKGFKFDGDSYPGIGYNESMDDVVGEQGTVNYVYEDRFEVDFSDNCWTYPLELAYLAKIEESTQEISHEDSQIDWRVGQEVFCCVFGRGKVIDISKDIPYPLRVNFKHVENTVEGYTMEGKLFKEAKNRTLFFSEPKIIAETKPPKKPFMPVFKQGDTIIVKWADTTRVLILEKETERQVKGMDGQVWDKDPDVHFYKLGEQVKFS